LSDIPPEQPNGSEPGVEFFLGEQGYMGLIQFRLDAGRVVVFQDEEKIMGIALACKPSSSDPIIPIRRSSMTG
jgi:hypothetical protein